MIELTLNKALQIQLTSALEGSYLNIRRERATGKYYLIPTDYLGFVSGYPPVAPSRPRSTSFWGSILTK